MLPHQILPPYLLAVMPTGLTLATVFTPEGSVNWESAGIAAITFAFSALLGTIYLRRGAALERERVVALKLVEAGQIARDKERVDILKQLLDVNKAALSASEAERLRLLNELLTKDKDLTYTAPTPSHTETTEILTSTTTTSK